MTSGQPLMLFNSLGRVLEKFVPASAEVGLYTCGVTVYSYPHLGNMRAYVFADTLRRALRWKGYPVRHITNITDVGHAVADAEIGEDKLEVAAARERRTVEEIAAYYTDVFFADVRALNILPAHEYPRATAYVSQMIEFAAELEAKGHAYRLPSGLYFDTATSPGYGALALLDVDGQQEGARVEPLAGRRRKSDFALWRTEAEGQIRAMRWDSPWGWGAPGWHLECSVMSMELLGRHFDIHTGGVDHREIHHVNEIAQSEAYLSDGQPWVRYWMHNEFVQLGGAKMAKSAGGAPRLADLAAAGLHPLAYRMFLLGGHYRAQVSFASEAVEAASASLRRLVAKVPSLPAVETYAEAVALAGGDEGALRLLSEVDAAISLDLGTPQLLAVLQEAVRYEGPGRIAVLAACESLLGLSLGTLAPADLELRREAGAEERAVIERLVAERSEARAARDWPRADRIRAELDELGVQVTDTADGPVWVLR
ncbi:cysteine--tRNA ligase [Longispora albida]|uniref:cysteine--tRNA ligase n=1 Tax=Longispora albida TaxID=203523 RepID=UPI0003A7B8A6|nr:cysteine--tRNA ligase [Longispora albida]